MPSKEQIEKAEVALCLSTLLRDAINEGVSSVTHPDWICRDFTSHPAYRRLTALSAAEGVKPRVKPLPFVDAPKGKYLSETVVADSLIGPYSVTLGSGAAYFDNRLLPGKGIKACDAHYEARILSALQEGE